MEDCTRFGNSREPNALCQGRTWDSILATALGTSPLLSYHAEGLIPFFCTKHSSVPSTLSKGHKRIWDFQLQMTMPIAQSDSHPQVFSLFAFMPESHHPAHAAARAHCLCVNGWKPVPAKPQTKTPMVLYRPAELQRYPNGSYVHFFQKAVLSSTRAKALP